MAEKQLKEIHATANAVPCDQMEAEDRGARMQLCE